MRKWFVRVLKIAGLGLLLIGVAAGVAWIYWGYSPVPEAPPLKSEAYADSLLWDGYEREYLSYVPTQLPAAAPLVMVLHGSVMNGAVMRIMTGYLFDRLADEKGFAVVYPDGFMGHWNDCRNKANFAAKRHNIDDEGFLQALIDRMVETHAIDPARVFLVGYSNGGHMALRMAFETPEKIAGVAVAAVNLPEQEDSDCRHEGATPPVMLANGTGDRWNPFDGGESGVGKMMRRGRVWSALESALVLARRNGISGEARMEKLPDRFPQDGTELTRYTFEQNGRPYIVLYGIHNGGHVFPQPAYRFPRMYGITSLELNMPLVALDFFGL